uniref:Disease resistance protein n=1 Tax=Solanum tuberosum TaxID=4113 RepID=M1CQW2_SOLTU
MISGDKQKYMDIINLSLPNHLTNGFLYFGKHFEDEILVRELIQLWIAEEFAVEDVAKDYVKELIDSNLVMVVRRNFFGEVKAIGMHDLLREFCLTRGRLENLEVLKLESNAFEGDQQWDVDNEEFQNLKFLMFYNMNIPQWNFSDMFFPNLQHLIFRNSRLKTIPRDFENLLLQQMIEVSWCKCSRDALNTAEEIKKTQTDMGNHEFKLIIKSREDDDHEEDEDDHEDAHQKKLFS